MLGDCLVMPNVADWKLTCSETSWHMLSLLPVGLGGMSTRAKIWETNVHGFLQALYFCFKCREIEKNDEVTIRVVV